VQALQQAVTQLRIAVDGWNGTYDTGFDEFQRVFQLHNQAEAQVYTLLYQGEYIRQALNQAESIISRLGFLYQQGPNVINSPMGLQQLTQMTAIEISQLRALIQNEMSGGWSNGNQQQILAEVQTAEYAAQILVQKLRNPYSSPAFAQQEFITLQNNLNTVRLTIYQAGFSMNVFQQLNQVLQLVRQLGVYFVGCQPIGVIRPGYPYYPPVVRPIVPVYPRRPIWWGRPGYGYVPPRYPVPVGPRPGFPGGGYPGGRPVPPPPHVGPRPGFPGGGFPGGRHPGGGFPGGGHPGGGHRR
jgi:hypothetical protein